MICINPNLPLLPGSYLFTDIAHRVAAYRAAHPDVRVISLGIGDVTRPLAPSVIAALHKATDEMAQQSTFHGYGPERGYPFLRKAIVETEFAPRDVHLDMDEIFISDGSKCDLANFQELFAADSRIAVSDPVYPVGVDSNAMAGRAGTFDGQRWSKLLYLPCTRDNGFIPEPPREQADVIYLCSPNNPTGTAMSREALTRWVEYAHTHGSLLLFDAAYEAFITDPEVPHSIYEVDGAREVAVEMRSFSKSAGFTGLRCAYVVVPRELCIGDGKEGKVALNAFWNRRQTTKYNGCPYIVQRAAEAACTPQGREEGMQAIRVYQRNARLLSQAMRDRGLDVYGGQNAPYLWVSVPAGSTSWQFFDMLLEKAGLVCTPGVGFGACGEGFIRLTSFGTPEDTDEAIRRLSTL